MYLTWLDSNSWLIELAGKRILLDPWLVGKLVFGNLPWLITGTRSQQYSLPEPIDLILLSQGIEDHSHPETLKSLDKSIPVVASASAAKVAQRLGFTQVTALNHGQTLSVTADLTIQATPGAFLGPTRQENGYLLTEGNRASDSSTVTLYYEPHGFHPANLQDMANSIEVVIAPLSDLTLPLVGPVVQGAKGALTLAEQIKPRIILPTSVGGDVVFSGLLVSALKVAGTVDEFRQQLADRGSATQVLAPRPGERTEIVV